MIKWLINPDKILVINILPLNSMNISLNEQYEYSAITRNRELTRLTHTSTKLKFELHLKLIGLNLYPTLTSTQFEHGTYPGPFVVTSLKFISND